MVPEGWEILSIGDLGKVTTGSTPKTAEKTYYGGEIPFVSPADLGGKKLITTAIKTLTEEGYEKTRSIPEGSTLFCCIGSVGKIGLAGREVAVNQQINAVTPSCQHDNDFVYYALAYRAPAIAITAAAQVVPIINKSNFSNQLILSPPLPEQKKIAKILSIWDQAITATERLLENSQQRKKGVMQQLLTGNTRLPGFEGEWKSVEIKDLGEVVTGFTPPKSAIGNYGEDFSWATAEDFKSKYVSNTKIKISQQGLKNKRLLPKGSVLVTCIASIGRNAIANEDLCTNQQINSIIVNECNSNEFVYYQVEFNTRELLSIAGTTAVPIVNKSSFEKIKLSIPPLKEQNAIADILMTADLEIDALKQRLSSLTQEKKSLMQQLLTGKRRVDVDTEAA